MGCAIDLDLHLRSSAVPLLRTFAPLRLCVRFFWVSRGRGAYLFPEQRFLYPQIAGHELGFAGL